MTSKNSSRGVFLNALIVFDALVLIQGVFVMSQQVSTWSPIEVPGLQAGLLDLNSLKLAGLWQLRRWGIYLFFMTYIVSIILFIQGFVAGFVPSWTGAVVMLYGLLWFWAISRRWSFFT